MSEELEVFIKILIYELNSTGTDTLRTPTLIHCIERAVRKVQEGSEDGPDEGDGWDDGWC